jgi:hypothetical protein
MKKSLIISIIAISLPLAFNACNNKSNQNATTETKSNDKVVYTCTMHPEVRSDKPGDCPKCGMTLVKMESADTTKSNNKSDTTKKY